MPIKTAGLHDCLLSIAEEFGLPSTQPLLDHADNQAIKDAGTHLLAPGTQVAVPEPAAKEEAGSTGAAHTFKIKRPRTQLRLRLLDAPGAPLAEWDYKLTVAGLVIEGKLDAEGRLRERVPATATEAELELWTEVDGVRKDKTLRFQVGAIDPPQTIEGMQARLTNLGFPCGPIDGDLGPTTHAALEMFRAMQGIESKDHSGEPDDETCRSLSDEHGC